MRGSVTVCKVSDTTMPRLQLMPADSASAVLGRMPTAITTRSAGMTPPSLNFTAPTRPDSAGMSSAVCFCSRNLSPLASRLDCSKCAAGSSSWRSSSQGERCTTVTSMPRAFSPLAASRPRRPPPMTTACLYLPAASIMASTSAMSRKPTTPGRSAPGTGRMKGVEPVAMSRRS